MVFKCFKDKLYLLILFAINIIFIFSILICFIYSLWFGLFAFSLLLGTFNWYFFSIRYILDSDALIIKVMCFKKVIKYKEIVEIKQTANTISSFALSRARIGIRTSVKLGKFNYIYISPVDESGFLTFIYNKCLSSTKNKAEK